MSSDTRIYLLYDLTNCTTTQYKYWDIDNIVMTVTANDDCYFVENDSENYLLYENGNKKYPFKYETIDNVVKKSKIAIKMLDTIATATLHFVAYETQQLPNKITITQELNHCTTNFKNTEITANETINITITAEQDYLFLITPFYKINNGNAVLFTRIDDTKYTAEIITPNEGSIIINGSASTINGYSEYLKNCTISYSNKIFKVTANEGYFFDDKQKPYYIQTPTYIADITGYLNKVNDYEYILDTSKTGLNIDIYANALEKISEILPATSNSYGFCNIYLPTIDNLNELSKIRFFNSDMKEIDIFTYIFKCHKLFFNVNAEFNTSITLANIRTQINCIGTTKTFITENCGNVFVQEKYNNVFDYQFTKTRIYLPFIGFKEIDTQQIMNSTVNLKYKTNIIDGTTLAIISTDTRGEIYQFEGVASFDIPYMINQYKNSINHELYHNSAYLGNFIPSIQLITKKPYGIDNDNIFGYNVNQWCKIGNCNGYIKCSDIQLIISKNFITNSEMEKITTLLKEGVFV